MSTAADKGQKPIRKSPSVERVSKFSTAVNSETMEFIRAIEKFKAEKRRAFPSWSEILTIVKELGYKRGE